MPGKLKPTRQTATPSSAENPDALLDSLLSKGGSSARRDTDASHNSESDRPPSTQAFPAPTTHSLLQIRLSRSEIELIEKLLSYQTVSHSCH